MTSNPEVKFLLQGIQPPSRAYIGRDDQLLVQLTNGAVAQTVTVTYRLLLASGTIVPFQTTQAIAAFTRINLTLQLSEGFLLSVTISNSGNLPGVTCFAMAALLRTNQANPVFYNDILLSGYVTPNRGVSFPQINPVRPTDGRGNVRSITGTTPGAGLEISEGVPNSVLWRLMAFRFQIQTQALAGNRNVVLLIDDGSNELIRIAENVNVAPSQIATFHYYSNPFVGSDFGTNYYMWLDSAVLIGPAFRIRTLTNNIQVTDQYSAVQYLVEEWIND